MSNKESNLKQSLRKRIIFDQIKLWIELMDNKGEWASVKRHLWRAMIATQELIKRK